VTIVYLTFELIGLYLLSRWLTQTLYGLFHALFRTRSISVSLVTLLLFPGTVVHELSHLFTAEILGVRTGKLTLVPEGIQHEEIQTGSVAIAKTGPFRRSVIGLAPLIVGMLAVATLTYLYANDVFVKNNIVITLYYYLLFSISNSMFPSAVDMAGVWQLMVTILIIAIGAGIRIVLPESPAFITTLVNNLTGSLGIVLAVNGIVLLFSRILIDVIRKSAH